jgi:uncharacterized membrane protein YgcG
MHLIFFCKLGFVLIPVKKIQLSVDHLQTWQRRPSGKPPLPLVHGPRWQRCPSWETTIAICPRRKLCHAKTKNYIATQGRMLTTEIKLREKTRPTFHGCQETRGELNLRQENIRNLVRAAARRRLGTLCFSFVAVHYGLSKILKEGHQGVHSAPAVCVPVLHVEHGRLNLPQVLFEVTQSIHDHCSIIAPVTKGSGWVDNRESEEEEGEKAGPEVVGGDEKGRVEKWVVVGGRGWWCEAQRVAKVIKPLDPTGVGVRERGEVRGVLAEWLGRCGRSDRSQDRGEFSFRGGGNSASGGGKYASWGRVWDGRLPSPGRIPGGPSFWFASESGHDES